MFVFQIAKCDMDAVVDDTHCSEYPNYPPIIILQVEESKFKKNVPQSDGGTKKEAPFHCNIKVSGTIEDCLFALALPEDSSNVTRNQTTSKVPELSQLMEKVGSKVATKWYEIGLELGLGDSCLQNIGQEFRESIEKCCAAMFLEWLFRPYLNPSWKSLVHALHAVDKTQVASDVDYLRQIRLLDD